MMKINELRAGSTYKAGMEFPKGSLSAKIGLSEDKIITIDEHIMQVLFQPFSDCTCLWKFLKPIPLTEEWLLKLGFEIVGMPRSEEHLEDHYYDLVKNSIHFQCLRPFDRISIDYFDGLEHINAPKIEHVHQLQNLYFALTGEELKIDDN